MFAVDRYQPRSSSFRGLSQKLSANDHCLFVCKRYRLSGSYGAVCRLQSCCSDGCGDNDVNLGSRSNLTKARLTRYHFGHRNTQFSAALPELVDSSWIANRNNSRVKSCCLLGQEID